jgi:predicted ribosome quality control (RQC) complex YloA/Tae2 family protein
MNEQGNSLNTKEVVRDLRKIAKRTLKRISSKLNKQKEEYKRYSNWLWYKQIGDSILAKSTEIQRGDTTCTITNVHSGNREEISLNPKLTAIQNAEKYFRKSKKGKRGLEICSDQLEQSLKMLEKVNILVSKCDNTLLLDEYTEEFALSVNAIQKEMEELHLPKTATPGYKAGAVKIPYRHLTIDGWDIYIGKNDTQNDELSVKFAKPWDIWFHVAVHAGSHVVLRREKNSDWPPKQIIETVASIAAWFSKAKHTSYTEVTVAEARYVRKRRKSPPGQVMVEREKTVRVTPRSPQDIFKERDLKIR